MKKNEEKTINNPQQENRARFRNLYTKHLSLEDVVENNRIEANEYICSLCTGIYYKPLLDQCGHMFCMDCIHKAIEYTGGKCPINSSATVEKDKLLEIQFINNQLGKLSIFCRNSKLGCTWKGQFRDLDAHLSKACQKQKVPCKNEGCQEGYLREQESEHQANCSFKSIQCEYCKGIFLFKSLTEHLQNCQRMRIPCSQGCEELIEKGEMNLHLKDLCSNRLTDCLFSKIGCEKKIPMKDIQNHIGLTSNGCDHVKLLINSVDTYQNVLETINQQHDEFKKRLSKLEELLTDQQIWGKEQKKKKKKKYKHAHPPLLNEDKPTNNQLQDFHHLGFPKDALAIASTSDDEMQSNSDNSDNSKILHKKRERKNSEEEENLIFDDLSIFDTDLSSADLSISGNVITCISNDLNKQKCLFLRQNLTTYQDLSWKVKILHLEGKWMAVGVCFKDVVAFNQLSFKPKKKSDNHGGILITSDHFAWNSIISEENYLKLSNMPELSESTELVMKYSCSKSTITFTIGKWTRVLHGANAKKGMLCPCIVMESMNDSIEFTYI